MPSQWERFKQSNIAKIVIGYSLVVWVLIQLIEAVLPTFETPLWVAQTLTFLLILGFPIALLVGWAYEKLPAQSTDTDGVASVPQPAHSTPKKTLVLVGIGSCAVIGLFGFYMMPFIFDATSYSKAENASVEVTSGSNLASNYRGIRTSILLGETDRRRGSAVRTDIDVSPDGNFLVYLIHDSSNSSSEIMLRDLRYQDSVKNLGSVRWNGFFGDPKFSPSGDWVYIKDAGTLKRVRIEGGVLQTVAGTENIANANFAVAETKVFYTSKGDFRPIYIETAMGGATSTPIPSNTDTNYQIEDILPGEETLLVTTCPLSAQSFQKCNISALSSDNFEDGKLLIQGGFNPKYSSSGHITFVRDSTLWAVPFDHESLELIGPQVPVIQSVESSTRWGRSVHSISDHGRLIFVSGEDLSASSTNVDISWVNRLGESRPIPLPEGTYGNLALSPNEDKLALTRYEGDSSDIWVWDLNQEIFGRLTFGGTAAVPIWSKDGRTIIYSQTVEPYGIWSVEASGIGQPQMKATGQQLMLPKTISRDGTILYESGVPARLFTTASLDDRLSQSLDLSPAQSMSAQISPDGNWLAYASLETGTWEVYVRPWPDFNLGKWQASRAGGGIPLWSSDNEIFFWSGAGKQYSSEYKVEQSQSSDLASIRFFEPTEMFSRQQAKGNRINPGWQYSSKKDEFLMVASGGELAFTQAQLLAEQTFVTVVENWFPELEARAPVAFD